MFELILLAIGLAGFCLAGYLDLKTTEFPDWIPYSVIILALAVRGIFSFLSGDFSIIINSVIMGALFLVFGLALYFLKQWGDGDAWLFASMGFLFPTNPGFSATTFPFPLAFVFNFFLVSFLYLIIYSLALGVKNPSVIKNFRKELMGKYKGIAQIIGLFLLASIFFVLTLSFADMAVSVKPLLLPIIIALLFLFAIYGKTIEDNLFRRKIPVKSLKPGDVPVSGRWRMLKPKEVERLKKEGGFVWIKEGIRFAPVFAINLAVSLFFGDLFFWIFGAIV